MREEFETTRPSLIFNDSPRKTTKELNKQVFISDQVQILIQRVRKLIYMLI